MDIAVLDLAFDKISPTTLASWAQDGGAGGWVETPRNPGV